MAARDSFASSRPSGHSRRVPGPGVAQVFGALIWDCLKRGRWRNTNRDSPGLLPVESSVRLAAEAAAHGGS